MIEESRPDCNVTPVGAVVTEADIGDGLAEGDQISWLKNTKGITSITTRASHGHPAPAAIK